MSLLPHVQCFKAAMYAYQTCLQHSLCCNIAEQCGLCDSVQEVHALQLPGDVELAGTYAVLCWEQVRLWQPPGTACLLPLIKAVHQHHAAHAGQQPLENSLLSNCLASGIELQSSTSKLQAGGDVLRSCQSARHQSAQRCIPEFCHPSELAMRGSDATLRVGAHMRSQL